MRKVKINGIYKHFKGDNYIVVDIATHSETGEKYVVYRSLYGDGNLWVREYNMFLSEVDQNKYQNVEQKYRFELQNVESISKKFKNWVHNYIFLNKINRWYMYNIKDAYIASQKLGIKFNKFTPEEFIDGINIELEHGTINKQTNVTNDDLIATAKIALAHLNEFPNYYNRIYGLKTFEEFLKTKL